VCRHSRTSILRHPVWISTEFFPALGNETRDSSLKDHTRFFNKLQLVPRFHYTVRDYITDRRGPECQQIASQISLPLLIRVLFLYKDCTPLYIRGGRMGTKWRSACVELARWISNVGYEMHGSSGLLIYTLLHPNRSNKRLDQKLSIDTIHVIIDSKASITKSELRVIFTTIWTWHIVRYV
jgi:hypothetical protein